MAEQRLDVLQAPVREALHDEYARIEPSPFDVDWASARAILDAQQRRERAAGQRRWFAYPAPAWAALAMLVVLAVGVAVSLRPAPEPESSLARQSPSLPAATEQRIPVMWYTPTDELLEVSTLRYTARPAALTVYDPIHLEVRP